MTKSELVTNLAESMDLTATEAGDVVDAFFGTLAEALVAGKRIELRGFGIFEVREYAGYLGRNPATGEEIPVAPKRLPFFKMGKVALSPSQEAAGE